MKKLLHFVISIGLLLSGCASATEISVSAPASTIALVPSNTSTVTPSLTMTETPIQTLVVSPFIPIKTTPPPSFSSFLTAQASWNVCDGAEEPYYEKSLSPNGKWLAVICDPNDLLKFIGTKFVSLDSNVIWDVSFYETYGIFQKDEFPPDGIRNGRMSVVHWMKDGNYAYLIPYFCCVDEPGNNFFNYFQNAWALYRIDLRTGKITATLPPFSHSFTSGYNASLSPSDNISCM